MGDFDFRKYAGGALPDNDPLAAEESIRAQMDACTPDQLMAANMAADFFLQSIIATCMANGFSLSGLTNLITRKAAQLYHEKGDFDAYLEALRFTVSMVERGEF